MRYGGESRASGRAEGNSPPVSIMASDKRLSNDWKVLALRRNHQLRLAKQALSDMSSKGRRRATCTANAKGVSVQEWVRRLITLAAASSLEKSMGAKVGAPAGPPEPEALIRKWETEATRRSLAEVNTLDLVGPD